MLKVLLRKETQAREIQIILKKTKQDFCVLPVIFIYFFAQKPLTWSRKPVRLFPWGPAAAAAA